MTPAAPFVRRAGSGPTVICLHSNASSSSQWRGLLERLAPTHHVLAPDGYGCGKSPEWPSDRVITLADEVALIEPLLAQAPQPAVLVGHSYGAAVALMAALMHPGRVRALALYEPTLFCVIDRASPPPNAADGIRAAVAAAAAALDRGDANAAAQAFIDYWMHPGSWAAMPPARQAPIAASMVNVRRWAHALLAEPTPLAAFGRISVPVLYMVGADSTASAHGVARVLLPALPNARLLRFEGLGHMAPVTQPDRINAAIQQFLADIEGAAAAPPQ